MQPGRKPPPTAARSAAAFLTHGFSPARAARWMNPALVRRHEHPLAGEHWAAQTSPETHARAIQRSTCPSPRPSPRSPIRPSANSAFPPTRGQAPAPPAPGALAHPAPPARPDVNAISTSYRPGSKRAADRANAAGQSRMPRYAQLLRRSGEGRVPVRAAAGPVVPHRRPRIGGRGGFLHVPQRQPCVPARQW